MPVYLEKQNSTCMKFDRFIEPSQGLGFQREGPNCLITYALLLALLVLMLLDAC